MTADCDFANVAGPQLIALIIENKDLFVFDRITDGNGQVNFGFFVHQKLAKGARFRARKLVRENAIFGEVLFVRFDISPRHRFTA